MPKKIILTDQAPAPIGPYSQAVSVGDLVFLSGQIPLDPKTGELVDDNIEDATTRVLENIRAVLEAEGLSFAHVVKTTVFMRDLALFPRMNAVYATVFADRPPARSTVQAAALPKGVSVEIEVIASRQA
ncbi:MAG: RidA family protein [Vicinamibacteria bacterium]|jgi:2-iminobutanoate/2-iminopropanoate deaminase|nr:RidA family protein [Vicinamibacteria bacterium]